MIVYYFSYLSIDTSQEEYRMTLRNKFVHQKTILMKKQSSKWIIHHETIENMVDVYKIVTSFHAEVILFVPKCDLTPEDMATLQAMYSRSNRSIIKKFLDLMEQTKLAGAKERIIGQTHKGYGHKSIGDLGHLLLCYEGVSMLGAKGIQDSQQYSGQEASTRYIPFDKQPFLVAENDEIFRTIDDPGHALSVLQENARKFYLRILPVVQDYLFSQYCWEDQEGSRLEDEAKKQEARENYERAIKARAFDIVRGFLPAGCTTNLAWWTSISHAADHLSWMRCHVLAELRELAEASQQLLEKVYPTSFEGRQIYPERETYKTDFYQDDYYLIKDEHVSPVIEQGVFATSMFPWMLQPWKKYILERPKGQDLPWQMGESGVIHYEALLDFASFRDQQRHRAVVQRQGLITAKYGFHEWYLNQLPESVHADGVAFLADQLHQIEVTKLTPFEKQYLFPMGMRIPTRMVGTLPKMLYLVELRAQTTVHPTFHANAFQLAQEIKQYLCSQFEVGDVPLYVNPNVGEFSWKRGTQTIKVGGKAISDQ